MEEKNKVDDKVQAKERSISEAKNAKENADEKNKQLKTEFRNLKSEI